MARRSRRWAVSAGLSLAMLAAGCASLGEPYLGSFPTSSTPINDGTQAGDAQTGDEPLDPIGDITVQGLPPRPSGYLPSIVLVTAEGIGVIERTETAGNPTYSDLIDTDLALESPVSSDTEDEGDTSTTTAFSFGSTSSGSTTSTTAEVDESMQWVEARDDLFGGLVVQAVNGEVKWFPGTGGGSRDLLSVGDFLEVGYNAGTPEALTLRTGQVTRTRLIDNDSTLFASLNAGEELIDISSSGGIVALATSDEECGSVDFLGADGAPLPIDPFGSLVCLQTARPSVGQVAMSPDGEALAFTLIQYREDGVELETELKAIELTSGAELLSTPIGGSGEAVSSLDFDGVTAVVLRRSSSFSEVVIADADSVEVLELDDDVSTIRSVSFARLPLSTSLLRPPEPAS